MILPTHSASELVAATDLSRQAVYATLRGVPPSVRAPVSRWRFADLPQSLCNALARTAQRRGVTVEKLLQNPPRRWEAPVEFNRLPERIREEAALRCEALAQPLVQHGKIPEQQWRELTRVECRRVFGRTVADKSWFKWVDLALARDRGFGEFARLDLFVPESVYVAAPAASRSDRFSQAELNEVLSQLGSRSQPTLEDQAFLWKAAFEHFETLCGDKPAREQKRARRSLINFLHGACPALAASPAALADTFRRKFAQWIAGDRTEDAIRDKRSENSGRPRQELCPECAQIAKGAAAQYDGRKRQAWRELHARKLLCPACQAKWTFNPRVDKSYLPRAVDCQITADVEAAVIHRRGPKHARLCSPYVLRDHSNYGPGDSFEADDVTLNHVFYAYDLDAAGKPYIGRGECLLAIDRRTDYPLGYKLILGDPDAAARYTSAHVRLLWLAVHDRLGLCHRELWHENGVWAARLINGARQPGWRFLPWRNVEAGLRDPRIQIEVRNTRPGNPRSKLIERMLGSLQQRMRAVPGFVGFNERLDKREAVDGFIRRVEAGEHPGAELLSVAEYRNVLDQVLVEYRQEIQNGRRLPGVSPEEAWLNGIGKFPGIATRPLRNLGVDARFLLATHGRLATVRADGRNHGIKFKIGRQPFVFWGPELEPWQNREIEVRLHLEEPELLFCRPSEGNPFVLRARVQDANGESRGQLAQTARERASWMRRGKIIADNLPHPIRYQITRDNEQTQADRRFGAFVHEQTQEHRAARATLNRTVRAVAADLRQLGTAARVDERNVEQLQTLAERAAAAESKIRQSESETH